jgi:predicted Zn finger-like uncharacterized protein
MLTRCPACQTVFRVMPEQLRARQGRVRCGHCRYAFNALDTLIENPLDETSAGGEDNAASVPPAPESPPQAPLPKFEDDGAGEIWSLDEDDEAAPPHSSKPTSAEATGARTEADDSGAGLEFEPLDDWYPEEQEIPLEEADALLPEEEADSVVEQAGVFSAPPEDADAPPESPTIEPATDAATPEPVAGDTTPALAALLKEQEAAPEAIPTEAGEAAGPLPVATPAAQLMPRPPSTRPTYWLAVTAGTLAALLLAQAAVLLRQPLARSFPALRPPFEALCAGIGCAMPLPADARAISIETSDLSPEPGRPGMFTLHATMRNRAPYVQALPHLELSLTDVNDKALARRVFAPQEWGPDSPIDKGFAADSETALRLVFKAEGVPAVGYRVYAFYP